MDYLEKARGLAPSSEEVLVRHAELALEIGVIPTAALSVEPLARMRPKEARYQLFLGRVWAGLRKMGEASEALLKAVALDPELTAARRRTSRPRSEECRSRCGPRHLTTGLCPAVETEPWSAASSRCHALPADRRT